MLKTMKEFPSSVEVQIDSCKLFSKIALSGTLARIYIHGGGLLMREIKITRLIIINFALLATSYRDDHYHI